VTTRAAGARRARDLARALAGPDWQYRRRARLGARFVTKKGRSLVGCRERHTTYVTDIDTCHVLAPPAGELLRPLGELISALSIRERLPQIELAIADAVVALVLRVLQPPSAADLERLRAFEQERGVRFYLQPGGPATVRPLTEPAPVLSYALPEAGVVLQFEPGDFIQVNGAMNRPLVQRAITLLAPGPGSRVLDLYCGLGNFTLALARHAAAVVGGEGDTGLVERARANARRNGIDNATFHVANLAVAPAPASAWLAGGISHVLLDPPRAGALELLPAVAALSPERVVYVSCHPATRRATCCSCTSTGSARGRGVADMFPRPPTSSRSRCSNRRGEESHGDRDRAQVPGERRRLARFAHRRELLRQGYLANTERCSVRVRLAGGQGWLSVKAMTPGVARAEYAAPVAAADAAAMLDGLCQGPLIEKWRHHVIYENREWEIDEFLGENSGLVIAELELEAADAAFARPPWVGAEVTDDVRFYNFRLATEPFGRWPENRVGPR
jgi:23S rRNA (uracil1939-C5)-methyltransferase